MEISKKYLNDLFKDAKCYYTQSRERSGHFTIGRFGFVSILEASEQHVSSSFTFRITKIDISDVSLERKYKIYELFEAHIKGELTIR